jgi:chromosome segregation ATPase
MRYTQNYLMEEMPKLELVDSEDPLEAGLEMLVSPPGKRLQSITLLSGENRR